MKKARVDNSNKSEVVSSVHVPGKEFMHTFTENQDHYLKELRKEDNKIVICVGPTGTGKTAIACYYAIGQLLKNQCKRIIITRPLVTVDNEDMGFLPGSLEDKFAPWSRPLMDAFLEKVSLPVLKKFIEDGQIEIVPLGFIRGRTFKDSIVILDEAQNTSPGQMLTAMTRLGWNSKLIITGDLMQRDVMKNGLADIISRFTRFVNSGKPCEGVSLVNLADTDIIRSDVCKMVLKLYGDDDTKGGGPGGLCPPTRACARESPPPAPERRVLKGTGSLSSGHTTSDCAMIPLSEMDLLSGLF
jgi:phosphate starvation-inducible PhoH-like protein